MKIAAQTSRLPRIAFVAHEFGRYPGHGGIATYLRNQIDSILRLSEIEIHVFCVNRDVNYQHPRVVFHPIQGLDFQSQQAVTAGLLELQPMWVEVAEFGALCNDILVRRELGQVEASFPIIVNHHTGCREIWEWGTGIRLEGCTDNFLRGCHVLELSQARLADANVSVSTFLTDYLQKRDNLPFLQTIFPYFPIEIENQKSQDDVGRTEFRIFCLGRFEQRKKQEDLIDATVALLREGLDIHTTFVGNSIPVLGRGDDYRQICYERIPVDLRKHFNFIDFASPESVRHLYQSADLFCIPSPMENFPTTALEAISMGLPVMGSRWSGIRDMVGDIELLFDPTITNDLTDRLRYWAKAPRGKLRQQASLQRIQLQNLLSESNTTATRLKAFARIPIRAYQTSNSKTPKLRALVLDSDAGKATRKMAQRMIERNSDFILAMSHEALQVGSNQVVDFVYCPDNTSPLVLHELMQSVRTSAARLLNMPLTLSSRYDEVTDIPTAIHLGRLPAFAGRLSSSRTKSTSVSWNERLASYLVANPALLSKFNTQARPESLSIPLRTCALRAILPFETKNAYNPTDSRPHLRLLAQGF